MPEIYCQDKPTNSVYLFVGTRDRGFWSYMGEANDINTQRKLKKAIESGHKVVFTRPEAVQLTGIRIPGGGK